MTLSFFFRAEQASVSFDQFCCILTEFRNLPADNQRRLWDVLLGKATALLYSVVSPVSRILCKKSIKIKCKVIHLKLRF